MRADRRMRERAPLPQHGRRREQQQVKAAPRRKRVAGVAERREGGVRAQERGELGAGDLHHYRRLLARVAAVGVLLLLPLATVTQRLARDGDVRGHVAQQQITGGIAADAAAAAAALLLLHLHAQHASCATAARVDGPVDGGGWDATAALRAREEARGLYE